MTPPARPRDLRAAEGEVLLGVAVGEVHELVGEFVVVLQRVHEGDRLDAVLERRVEGQPEELGIARGQRVMVGGAVDEVVGQVRAASRGLLDVVDGQIQLLEGEAADLADHAGDELVRRIRQRVALRPGRAPSSALFSTPEEAVGVQPQRRRAEVAQRVQRVADHQPHPGEVGSSQLIEGWPSLK